MFAFLALAGLMGLFALTAAPSAEAQEDSTTIEYPENGKDPVATLTATDPEDDTIMWSVAQPAGGGTLDFDIGAEDGVLEFLSPPDFEAPTGGSGDDSNTYVVTVTATDTALTPNIDTFTVTVKVTNVAETGKVTWGVDHDANDVADTPTLVQFQVGANLIVAESDGVTDGDVPGNNKNVTERFQWHRSPGKTAMGTAIDGATSSTYAVTTEDIGMYLRVEAFYNVGTGREESASLTSDYAVLGSRSSNEAPEFDPAAVTREVSEGKKGMTVGTPVRATDDITNALNYTLGGADAARFEIDQKTGQIKTLVDLDREGVAAATADILGSCQDANADSPDPECTVTVTATDSAGEASDPVATVTITLKNVGEKPTFSTTDPAIGMKMISLDEGMTALADAADAADVTYSATDPEGLSLTYHLMGPDGAKFELSASRVLSFKEKPDYEKPTDRNKDNVYEVTVRASDGTMHTDHMVKVTVTDADEAPTVMGKDSVNYAENGKDVVATFTATDPEGVTPITWSLATNDDLEGVETADITDSSLFEIDEDDGMLKFRSPPDYEASESGEGGGDANNDNTYHVVVLAADATDNQGYHKVTVKVTKVAEKGKVTWTVDPAGTPDTTILDTDNTPIVQFQVGAALTASATDGDIRGSDKAVEDNITRRWYRGSKEIDGETSDTYTVTTEDVGKRIRVVVAYTVGTDREESASLTSDYRCWSPGQTTRRPSSTRPASPGRSARAIRA